MEVYRGPWNELFAVSGTEWSRRGHWDVAAWELAFGRHQLPPRGLGRAIRGQNQEGGRQDHLLEDGGPGPRLVRDLRGSLRNPDGFVAAESECAPYVGLARCGTSAGRLIRLRSERSLQPNDGERTPPRESPRR